MLVCEHHKPFSLFAGLKLLLCYLWHYEVRMALSCLAVLITVSCSSTPATQEIAERKDMALIGATIYPSPSAAAIQDGVVLISRGKITAVGRRNDVEIPPNTSVIDAAGMVLTAGYWNSHVHFMEPKWAHADSLPAAQLQLLLQEMLTGHGFTHVFDIATVDVENLLALRARIDRGEVPGPRIFTAGIPFTPAAGSPFYIAPLKLPEISTPQEAAAHVREQIAGQADGIKLWSASPDGKKIVYMPVAIIKEAVSAAHALGKPVFAHPTDNKGVAIAVEGGVDVLAHSSPEDREGWSEETISKMLAAKMAFIPTLQLYKWDLEINGYESANHSLVLTAVQQLEAYAAAGGEILFGTDVGYVTEYSPADEYALMAQAGLSFSQILASLTTAPAARFGLSDQTGTIAPGMNADLVLLARDPKQDPKAFAEVVYTFREGVIIYKSAGM